MGKYAYFSTKHKKTDNTMAPFELASDPKKPEEYRRITKELFFREKDGFKNERSWNELLLYVDFLIEFCKKKRFDLEEIPMRDERQVQLKSFVGSYKFKSESELLRPQRDIDKLDDDEFHKMTVEISHWATMLGSPFLNAVLNVLSPVLGEDELTLVYSGLLINYTESALAEYIPPVIQRRRYVSSIPVGKILVPQTIRHSSSDQLTFVSQRIKFDVESLPMLLLISFHREMADELRKLRRKFVQELNEKDEERTTYEIYPLRIERSNRIYHTNFILSPLKKVLLERSYEVDFKDARILRKTWKQASRCASLRDILLLWEAYIGKRTLAPQVTQTISGGYMLKPVCKLYELWVLRTMVDALRETISERKKGEEVKFQIHYSKENGYKALPADFAFENDMYTIIYNGGQNQTSVKDFAKFNAWGPFQFKPDYVIAYKCDGDNRIGLIADAKYKNKVELEDRRQMLAYLAYFGQIAWTKSKETSFPEGLIIYTGGLDSIGGEKREYEREKPRTTITEICLKPGMDGSVKLIKDLLERALGFGS